MHLREGFNPERKVWKDTLVRSKPRKNLCIFETSKYTFNTPSLLLFSILKHSRRVLTGLEILKYEIFHKVSPSAWSVCAVLAFFVEIVRRLWESVSQSP